MLRHPLARLAVCVSALALAAAAAFLAPAAYMPLVTLGALVVGALVGAVALWGWLGDGLRPIIAAVDRMAEGELGVEVPVSGGGGVRDLAQSIKRLSTTLAETHQAATMDRLTGVANRPSLLATLFSEVERSARYDRPLSVAFIDLDRFKPINDTYGHEAGDLVLASVARVFRDNVRANDTVGRYGGEEFLVVLPETTPEEATGLAEKLRDIVQRSPLDVAGTTLGVTISIGIAGGRGQRLRVDELVRDADAAMYSAKTLGRNQTFVFEEPDEDALIRRAPISPEGRARAAEVGRLARDAAELALSSVIMPLPHYGGKPSARIATIAVALARELGLNESDVGRIRVASLLHDIGKVAVAREILDKPAALSATEWQSVTQHPRIGQVILEQASSLKEAAAIILHHHEWYSGHGYPYGLRGREIPLGARIVSIADAYDAMISDRPYKSAISHDAALAELQRWAGTQFDPRLVESFCHLYASSPPVADLTLLAEPEHGHDHDHEHDHEHEHEPKPLRRARAADA